MKRHLVVVAILLGMVGPTAWLGCRRGDTVTPVGGSQTLETQASEEAGTELGTWVAELYFPGGAGMLLPEPHELPASDQPSERAASLVATLLSGPRGKHLNAPLAADIAVRRIYVVDEGRTAYLDLESPAGTPPPASGSTRELLTVYSLVNTIVLNVPEIEHVVLLWNSRQLRTFAGHVDTARPLVARQDLIAAPRE